MLYKIIGDDKKVYGPATAEQVRQWQAEGRVNSDTLLQAEGSTAWKPFSSFPEFGFPPVVSMPPAAKSNDDMAVAGLVFGVLSNVCCCFFLFGIMGLIFSIVALNRSETHPQRSGRGMAVAGLILSILGLTWHFLSFSFGNPWDHMRWWHHYYWRHW